MFMNLMIVFLAYQCVMCLGSTTDRVQIFSPGENGLGYKFELRTTKWYKFHKEGMKWIDSVRVCAMEGANLAVINSDLEAQVLVDLFKENEDEILYSAYTSWVAIGIYRDKTGFWRTLDGNSVKHAGFAKWYKGQPLEIAEARFGFMSLNGELMSWPDDSNVAFICEK